MPVHSHSNHHTQSNPTRIDLPNRTERPWSQLHQHITVGPTRRPTSVTEEPGGRGIHGNRTHRRPFTSAVRVSLAGNSGALQYVPHPSPVTPPVAGLPGRQRLRSLSTSALPNINKDRLLIDWKAKNRRWNIQRHSIITTMTCFAIVFTIDTKRPIKFASTPTV